MWEEGSMVLLGRKGTKTRDLGSTLSLYDTLDLSFLTDKMKINLKGPIQHERKKQEVETGYLEDGLFRDEIGDLNW